MLPRFLEIVAIMLDLNLFCFLFQISMSGQEQQQQDKRRRISNQSTSTTATAAALLHNICSSSRNNNNSNNGKSKKKPKLLSLLFRSTDVLSNRGCVASDDSWQLSFAVHRLSSRPLRAPVWNSPDLPKSSL